MEDKYITCVDCGNEFVWRAKDQAFMEQLHAEGKIQGELTLPKRCKECREKKKRQRERHSE